MSKAATWAWQAGRQGTGYQKLRLLGWRRFDVYLLRFPEGAHIPVHRDPVDGAQHFRINCILRHARRGGEFVCADPILDWPRLKLFRPDRSEHAVTPIEAGTRWVLSIGLALT